MDPDKALADMREAFDRGDWLEVADQAQALDYWLSHGGFLPDAWNRAHVQVPAGDVR